MNQEINQVNSREDFHKWLAFAPSVMRGNYEAVFECGFRACGFKKLAEVEDDKKSCQATQKTTTFRVERRSNCIGGNWVMVANCTSKEDADFVVRWNRIYKKRFCRIVTVTEECDL